ncbi:fluoride efflux transporter CrcB [Luteibacter pinisoli]|uniref:Fluoride-specific ion channel FluC n=1 Tax=Luteibacter pinisoli TaxID=2589080 RepID=A0A4Y5Z279_9GAMM|nr:fluoride efflux transporter CrcB [Luteibacter pinisoli]QDE38986.1 fluoride efflux transporter CrcB [Luteibacter pinisoli]
MGYLLVFIGGGLGSVIRYALSVLGMRLLGQGFPWATLFINILGSAMMGALTGWLVVQGSAPASLRLFVATGLLGGFTTFSTFSLETVLLYERGQLGLAVAYVAASVVIGVGALVLAMKLARGMA